MSSAVAAHKRAFGEDLVPVSYEDLELADLIVLVGSNTAWCHPVLYQRIVEAKERRPALRVVVIDPRRTPTCDIADLHLPLRAGTDVWLFNGCSASWRSTAQRPDFVDAPHANGARTCRSRTTPRAMSAPRARGCGLDAEALRALLRLVRRAPQRVVTLFSQGVNQSSAGTDKANSIINCHLLTGRIGRPAWDRSRSPVSPTPWAAARWAASPTTLAAHMDLENADASAPRAGVLGVARASPRGRDSRPSICSKRSIAGEVKAVWIMAPIRW